MCETCANQYIINKFSGVFNLDKLKTFDLSNYENIYITGGEPGLLSKTDKKLLINYLKKTYPQSRIEVFTNGTNILDWDKSVIKLFHVINLCDDLIFYENTSYVIVINKKTNVNDLKIFINKYKTAKINLKNDTFNPLSQKEYDNILNFVGVNSIETIKNNLHESHFKNLKLENTTNKCFALPVINDENIFSKKISLMKNCICSWYNCIL